MQYHVIKRQVVVEREETYAHFPLFTSSKLRRQFTSYAPLVEAHCYSTFGLTAVTHPMKCVVHTATAKD